MSKFTNITDPKYRCSIGACPAVHRSEDGKTFVIVGELANPDAFGLTPGFEADVKISADLLLSSLGVDKLAEATEKTIADIALFSKSFEDGSASKDFCIGLENRLRAALQKIQGEG